MRHRTAKLWPGVGILIWPTRTISPETHPQRTPPAAKAKNKELTWQKITHCTDGTTLEWRRPTGFEFKKINTRGNHVHRKSYAGEGCFTVTRGTAVSESIQGLMPSLFIKTIYTIHNSKCVLTPSENIWSTQQSFHEVFKNLVYLLG